MNAIRTILATLAGVLFPLPTAAQQLTSEQCRDFLRTAYAVVERYNGRTSPEFWASIQAHVGKDISCTRPLNYFIKPGTKDRDAMMEITMLASARRVTPQQRLAPR